MAVLLTDGMGNGFDVQRASSPAGFRNQLAISV